MAYSKADIETAFARELERKRGMIQKPLRKHYDRLFSGPVFSEAGADWNSEIAREVERQRVKGEA